MIDEHALFSLHINVVGRGNGGIWGDTLFQHEFNTLFGSRGVRISGENVMDYFNPGGTTVRR